MDNLHEVYCCLKAMDSSKVTERKKNAGLLEKLLESNSVTSVLDKNTVPGVDNKVLTWNTVLKGVNRYIDTEIACLQSAKESQSAVSLSNRDKKRQELSNLFKLVVRTANKGSVKLDFNLLIMSIEKMLMDRYTQQGFGTEYISVLLKSVLRVRAYWLKISPTRWRKLTNMMCKLYSEETIDQGVVASAIQDLIHGCCLQGELHTSKIFTFFTTVFTSIRNLKDASVIKSILTSLNTFCKAVATNSRVQLCQFGETQMDGFVWLWSEHNADTIEKELVEFLHLLVRIHHPHGSTDQDGGAYAYNWDLWKEQLISLHEIIITSIDKMIQKYRFVSSSNVLSPEFAAFASDVFKQIPKSKITRHDLVSQSSQASQSGGDGGGSQAKRLKMSPENKSLLELICERSNTVQAIPWLQVLHDLLSKYPDYLSEAELATTLQVLTVQLAENKKSQVFQHLFKVLSVLIRAIQYHDDLKSKVTDIITTVWSHCISTINSRQAEVDGYQEYGFTAMACMITSGLISPRKEIWNLFLPSFSLPSLAAGQLLTALVVKQGLVENYVPSIIGAPTNTIVGGIFPLRQSLITWLLPGELTDIENMFPTAMPANRVAKILYSLTLKDLSVMNTDIDVSFTHRSSHSSLMETTYLKTSFDSKSIGKEIFKDGMDLLQRKQHSHGNSGQYVSVILDFLLKHLTSLSKTFEHQSQTCQALSWFCCVLSRLLYYFWEDNTVSSSIQHILKRMLGRKAAILMTLMQKEVPECLFSELASFSAVVTWKEGTDSRICQVAEFIRCCMPGSFVDMLVDFAAGKFSKKKDPKQALSKGHSSRKVTAGTSRPQVDLDFDILEPSGFHSSPAGADFDVENNMTETDNDSVTNQDVSDFLRKEGLADTDQLRVLCAEVLCKLTAYDICQMAGSYKMTVKAEMDSDYVNSRLLQLVSPELFDSRQALNVHLLFSISEEFLNNEHHVTLQDIQSILTSFRQTAKILLEDQQVCCKILSHLRYIIPHLCDDRDLPSEDLKYCRDVLHRFISHFWQVAIESTQHLKYEISRTVLDLLKYDPDSSWGELQISSGEDQTLSLFTVKQLFPKLLSDGSVIVRTFVAESLTWLFVRQAPTDRKILMDKMTQKKAFEAVFVVCSELLDVQQGQLSEERWQDEIITRRATCLQALLTIILMSPVCEKQCLLGLCQMVTEKTIPLITVEKMLNTVCRKKNYVDISSYMSCHLPYLIHNWLSQKMVNLPISSFPYRLLGYNDLEQFVRSHQDLLVSEVLINKLSIADVHDMLGSVHVQEALVSALPVILSHILPVFADKSHEDMKKSGNQSPNMIKSFAKATKCYQILLSVLSEQTVRDKVSEKLVNIVVQLLGCLSVEQTGLSMVYPESNPPYYSPDVVHRALDYLAKAFIDHDSQSKSTLITVLVQIPDGLYQVLLCLSSLLCHEHRAYEQQRHLQMYGLFLRMLLKELEGGLGGGWAAMIRDIINRLLFVLVERTETVMPIESPSYEEEVILTTLDILLALCCVTLQACPEEMAKYIHRIIDTVAGLVTLSEKICKSAIDSLTGLMSASAGEDDDLAKAMKILNPLPELPGLSQLAVQVERMSQKNRNSLKLHLDSLIEVCRLMSSTPSQGLARRINQLASYIQHNHREVEKLARTPEGLLTVKIVVSELMKMVTSSSQEVAAAAGTCLGAIGPIDFQSLSFPQEPIKTSQAMAAEKYKGQSYEKYCVLFHTLDSCLVEKNLKVVKTAGDILKKIMTTEAGAHFESDYTKSLQNESFLFHYLHPFRSVPAGHSVLAIPHTLTQASIVSFRTFVDKSDLWLGCSSYSCHEDWIKHLASVLLSTSAVQDDILKTVEPMCSINSQFCEKILPYLIHDLLQGGDAQIQQIMSKNISAFFHYHCISAQAPPPVSVTYPVCVNKQSLRTMLGVLQYLRTQKRPQERKEVSQNAWNNNFWLDLNYLEVAKAAEYCSANFSTILFTEIWWDQQRNMMNESSPTDSSLHFQSLDLSPESQLDPFTLDNCADDAGKMVQKLLLEAYRNIGDPDGIYGCGASKMAHPMARMQKQLHEQEHEKAMSTLVTGISQNISSVHLILQTVESCSADYILQRYLSDLKNNRDEVSVQPASSFSLSSLSPSAGVAGDLEEFYFRTAWKLGQWDLLLPMKQNEETSFHKSLYHALLSLRHGHLDLAKQALSAARCDIVKKFNPQVESCKSLYPFLGDLQCLSYLQHALEMMPKLNSSNDEEFWDLFAETDRKALYVSTQAVHFDYEKPLLHLMLSLAKMLASKGLKQAEALEIRALWSLAVGSRKARQYQLSEKCIQDLSTKIRNEHPTLTTEDIKLEQAKLFWDRDELGIAKNILKGLIEQLSKASIGDGKSKALYSEALCTYGNWLAQTKSETPSVIIREYLEKCVALEDDKDSLSATYDETALEGFASLARFADEQYQQITEHTNSPIFESKQNLLQALKSELNECQEFIGNSKYLKIMERTLVLDHQEDVSLQEARSRFLNQALLNYLKCLRSGDMHNLKVFRVVAVWFENCKNKEVNRLIEEYMDTIQTYKFLPLYYQLAARMSLIPGDEENFQPVLGKLMEKIARTHPHHALWIILALANAYKDDEMSVKEQTTRNHNNAVSGDSRIEEERVQAARQLLEKLRSHDCRLSSIVTNMEKLCMAYIELANWAVPNKTNRSPQALPGHLAVFSLAGSDNILLPSITLKVDPTCAYTRLVSPVQFGKTFRVVGGINLPKIITCLGSDGRERTQLVKGKDDLRQDAVMQQVFALVNELLSQDDETRKRHLKIRTYKVVPLSQKCGLLQWCEGTQPVGEYLIGADGAHARYRPKDWSARRCRGYLQAAGSKPAHRLKAYQEICAHFKPVFHHFFMENFLQPCVWFEKRLAYTRSVATTSVVGYILGIGDRHLMNILIDLHTAEMVHIDLGIAFEQGYVLPTPEVVPFRLTRDIVDGMGVTGVEGVFRRCCEKTMEVMKNNSESLLTIVQVLLYDPLSHWSLTPQQALAIQRKREQTNQEALEMMSDHVTGTGLLPSSGGHLAGLSGLTERVPGRINDLKESQNKLAERTLLRLKQKLIGQEDGSPLSVPGHVNLLIQKATSHDNLCRLYAGWQPYV